MFRKVPQVTVGFWVTKVLTTGMGEATSDTLVHQLAPVVAVALGAVGLVIALALQFAAPRYRPGIYWLAVVMVAVFGTMAADALHIELGIPYGDPLADGPTIAAAAQRALHAGTRICFSFDPERAICFLAPPAHA